MPDWMPFLLSVAAVLVSIVTAAREWRFGKPDALARYEDVVNKLIARVDDLESELEDYRIGVVILINQMTEAGIKPKWHPRSKKMDGKDELTTVG